MSEVKQREAINDFVEFWKDKGYEKGESQKFWLHLLTVLGVEHPEQFISFEDQVVETFIKGSTFVKIKFEFSSS